MSDSTQTARRLLAGLCVALILPGCDPDPQPDQSPDIGVRAVNDTITVREEPGGAELRLVKLRCRNPTAARDTFTVGPGGRPDSLVVGGHTLHVPAGAIQARQVTFTLIHHADPEQLRVELLTEPAVRDFPPESRPVLGLSYTTCDTSGVQLDSLRVVKNNVSAPERLPRSGDRIRALLGHLSEYVLASPL
jgi:hypothetical protein